MRGMLSWFLILLPFCVGRVEKFRSSVAKTFSFTQVEMSNAVVGMHSYYIAAVNCDIDLVNSRFLLSLTRRRPRREKRGKKGVWPRAPSHKEMMPRPVISRHLNSHVTLEGWSLWIAKMGEAQWHWILRKVW